MRKIVTILAAVCVLLFTGCPNLTDNNNNGNNSNNEKPVIFEPDLSRIKNFSNYSSLGVATKDLSLSRNARAVVDNEADVLVGLNKYTNLIEELDFDSSDEEESKELFVYCYKDTTPFLLVQFTRDSSKVNNRFVERWGDFSSIYFISKKTGKIYSMEGRHFYLMTYSDDYVFVSRCSQGAFENADDHIYKISEENDLLKIELYCMGKILGTDEVLSDKYGNLMGYKGKYLTAGKELKTSSSDRWFIGYDGKLYSSPTGIKYQSFCIDENGNEYTINYESENTLNGEHFEILKRSEYNILVSDDLEYYYYACDYENNDSNSYIFKITFENEAKTRGICTTIKEFSNSKVVKTGTKFFSINLNSENNEVTYYDIKDNVEEVLKIESLYLIEDIKKVNGGVECKGYKDDFVTKSSIFIDEDSLEITEQNLKKRSFSTITYLTPVN